MSFAVSLLGPPSPRLSSNRSTRQQLHVEDYDSSSSTESTETARTHSHPRTRVPFPASSSTVSSGPSFLLPPPGSSGRSSVSSTATSTPVPSRSSSPLPHFFSSAPSSTCTSDTESEPNSPLLGGRPRVPWWREEQRRWWSIGTRSRSRRRRHGGYTRTVKKGLRRLMRHPLFPRQPITIVLTLLLLTIFTIFITLLLIHILNPDKEPLPWRAYCSVPPPSSAPPDLLLSSTSLASYPVPATTGIMLPPFPPVNLDSLPPAGLLVGVFSMDSAFERRMLVRTTWASHPRSRDGAGEGDGGAGTSRTIVRFILGQPRKEWEKRVNLEMEMYNDIVILPVPENMNSGKTWSFFSWASTEGWVPPIYFNTSKPAPAVSYSNMTASPPPLAPHDPVYAQRENIEVRPKPWVRPDYVIKVDDDSFVMLAELEARLRLEMHTKAGHDEDSPSRTATSVHTREDQEDSNSNSSSVFLSSMHLGAPESSHEPRTPASSSHASGDPLVYWGYLVKNRFMAGELYALSWSLVDWVSNDPTVKGMTKGAEDKQTAKWIRLHPQASEVRWSNERCWIYDHPRAGTVYSHGFLFPSEVTRVRRNIVSYPDKTPQDILSDQPATWPSPIGMNTPTPAAWAHSSVSTFGVRYLPPVPDLTTPQGVEALIEGSDMSMIREGSPMTPEYAWTHREGRKKRYESKRVGGTVVVHFIKKNLWFMETALALLEGEDYSEFEKHSSPQERNSDSKAFSSVFSRAIAKHRRS